MTTTNEARSAQKIKLDELPDQLATRARIRGRLGTEQIGDGARPDLAQDTPADTAGPAASPMCGIPRPDHSPVATARCL
jgi:hypothetical protein